MRKEDRIRNRQQDRSERPADQERQTPQPDQVQGSESADRPSNGQRQPGKLPLPD